MERAFSRAQDFLDHAAVERQLAYRILGQEDSIVWQRLGERYTFEIGITLPLTAGMSAAPQIILPDGSIPASQAVQLLQAKAFRYYRFASSSKDLFESYRYLFLCLESLLYAVYPRQRGQREYDWLKTALREAIRKYALNLTAFSVGSTDDVEGFYKAHYKAIRCATFHAQSIPLLPGNFSDGRLVAQQVRLLQPIVTDLLKAHFGARLATSGATSHAMDSALRSLIPFLQLASTPSEVNLPQEIKSALEVVGYFEAFPKSVEDARSNTIDTLNRLIGKAREEFPFDLTPVTLDGKRPGYDDEWIVSAKTSGSAFQHRNIRSLALCFLVDQSKMSNMLLALFAGGLTGKTLSTNFDLPENCEVAFKIRVVLRQFQQFPREFASN